MNASARNQYTNTSANYSAPFPPIDTVTKPNLTTAEYAYYSNIAEQTARVYACYDKGPIRPIRINGRLNWPTALVKSLLGVTA
jgi:hypothetical protein